MEPLSVEAIQQHLPTQIFGQTIIYYNHVGSTNTELKKLLPADVPEGTLVVTDEQLTGRGRFHRSWYAPSRSSLLTSLLFRPTFLPPHHVQLLTMICALAASDAIATHTGISAGIKWPNDLIYDQRKLAGILTELGIAEEQTEWVIVGLGLNVNVDFNTFDGIDSDDAPSLAETAISLQMVAGQPVARLPLLQTYLVRVEERYDALRRGHSPIGEWERNLSTLNRAVKVTTPQSTFYGIAEGVAEDGALLVRLANGELEQVVAGDVTLRK